MMTMLRAGAIALAILGCAPALAQTTGVGRSIMVPAGSIPAVAIYCDPNGNGVAAICASGGGGGGGGDASAANQTTQIAAEQAIRDRLGALTSPAVGSTNYSLAAILTAVTGTLTVSTHAVTQSGTWAVNIGTGGLGSSGSPIFTQASTVTSGATGSAAPANAVQHGGRDPAGNLRGFAVDTGGRLLPGQGQVASTRTTLTASTATALEAAGVSGRILASITAETALTANAFLCTTQTTSCSATSYDFLIPSGAGAGTVYTIPFGTTGRLYAFSTGTPVFVLNSWTAQ